MPKVSVKVPLCAVCRKPVDLKTAKTDDSGKAVHEECYVARLKK
jgi:hypothetical protein